MHTPRKALARALLAASAACAAAAFEFAWDAPCGARPSTARLALRRGETADLRPRFPGADTNGWTFTLYWQTNGMGSAWWEDAEDPLRWKPSRDCGADSYLAFIRADAPGGANYRAALALDMLLSPGLEPNALEPPVRHIDFAAVEVANAPYYTKSETEAKIAELSPAPGNYAVVSNAAMNAVSAAAAETNYLSRTRGGEWIFSTAHALELLDGCLILNNEATMGTRTAFTYEGLRTHGGYADWDSVIEAANGKDGFATHEYVTNAVRDLSLGGIWDESLQVWWTPVMRYGALTYQATTNVNLNAGN